MKRQFLAACVVLLVGSNPAVAKCLEWPPSVNDTAAYDVVAYGRVTKTHIEERARHDSYAILDLEALWRGKPSSPITVYWSDSVHGFDFEVGKPYLFFAYKDDGRFKSGVCAPNCTGEACMPALKVLGEPTQRFSK